MEPRRGHPNGTRSVSEAPKGTRSVSKGMLTSHATPSQNVAQPSQAVSLVSPGSSKAFTCFGEDHSWSIMPLKFSVDEPQAKKWDNQKKGMNLKIKATISSGTFHLPITGQEKSKLPTYQITLALRDIQLTPP
jgi:hypothetical protein